MNILLSPDGHRRWAKQHGVTNAEAYEKTCQRIVDCCQYVAKSGLNGRLWLAITAPFNMERSDNEVKDILEATARLYEIGKERGFPLDVTFDGRLDLLPVEYVEWYKEQENRHKPGAFVLHNLLNFSINNEVTKLVNIFAHAAHDGPITHADLVENSAVKEHIDLIIRSGTKARLSAMAPWHSVDAELYFTDKYFPDFSVEDFAEVISDYKKRSPRNNAWLTADL